VTFLERVASSLGFEPKAAASSSDAVREIFSLPAANALTPVSESTAWTISAIAACVNLIAGAIASMPMNIHQRNREGVLSVLQNDDLWWILNEQMTPRWSAAAGWEYLVTSMLLHGDGFARIIRTVNGGVVGLEPIHPQRVRVIVSTDGLRLIYEIQPDPLLADFARPQPTLVLDQDDVIHVTGAGFNGLRSLSPLRNMLRMSGSVALATQEYSGQFFANSARPDYAIIGAAGTTWTPEKLAQIKEEIDARHRGAGNSHRPMFLSNGADIKTLSMPAEDMQLIETRQFQIEEIARCYGVPPFMIGHNEKTTSWGSGVDSMGIGFVRYTLSRHLTKIHNEFNRKLVRNGSKVLEFDTFELERADMKTMFEGFRIAAGRAGEPGFLTVPEIRSYLKRGTTPADMADLMRMQPDAQPTP
jgi:HK97 family phage portal protein